MIFVNFPGPFLFFFFGFPPKIIGKKNTFADSQAHSPLHSLRLFWPAESLEAFYAFLFHPFGGQRWNCSPWRGSVAFLFPGLSAGPRLQFFGVEDQHLFFLGNGLTLCERILQFLYQYLLCLRQIYFKLYFLYHFKEISE